MGYIFLIAAVFGVCFLVDKGFTKLFRSRPEHRSGLAVRPSKRYGSIGLIVGLLGIGGIIGGLVESNTTLTVCGILLVLTGVGLAAYYISTGIFYDDDSFLSASLGKKERTYRYGDILHQKLYVVQGGHYIIELHMRDGSAVMVQTQMEGYREFLNHAAAAWRAGREDCAPADPDQLAWFPGEEDA